MLQAPVVEKAVSFEQASETPSSVNGFVSLYVLIIRKLRTKVYRL